MLIRFDQVILCTRAVNKCTTWAQHELTPGRTVFEEHRRDRLFPRWAVKGTVSPRSASSCRRTSVLRQSDVMSMTRRQTSEDPAPPRYSSLARGTDVFHPWVRTLRKNKQTKQPSMLMDFACSTFQNMLRSVWMWHFSPLWCHRGQESLALSFTQHLHLFAGNSVIVSLCWYFAYGFIQVVPLYPEVGYVELDPESLWTGFVAVVKGAVQGTGTAVHAGLFIHNS